MNPEWPNKAGANWQPRCGVGRFEIWVATVAVARALPAVKQNRSQRRKEVADLVNGGNGKISHLPYVVGYD